MKDIEIKIHGVRVKRLTRIPDERGTLMEVLRADEDFFERFGQAYVTSVYPGVVKAWHCHRKQTDHFCVVSGMIKLVLADIRADSPTRGVIQEFFLGDDNPLLVKIPPGVHHGMKGLGEPRVIALNIPTVPYDHTTPDEIRLPWNSPEIPYDWNVTFK